MFFIFNIEAAVVLGIIAAVFYGFCALFPSLSGMTPPFVLAAMTFAAGAIAEFPLGLRPRIGLVIPVWCLGVAVFFMNVMVYFGPIPFYGLMTIAASIFATIRIRNEKIRWNRAQSAMALYVTDKSPDALVRLGTLANALFVNRWTRTTATYVQHNLAVLELLQNDVSEQFTGDELRSIESVSAAAKAQYRTSLIRGVGAFLVTKAEMQGIGRLR